ncbi:MAG: protein-L-isoaspartate(D-aspartate) O-methyltransferase [Rhodospirillales bacterium]|nr:MAG: protein-L-isoaspartate(D-aspartate) O-methyltransferase [Rhodospirillales bacterium]
MTMFRKLPISAIRSTLRLLVAAVVIHAASLDHANGQAEQDGSRSAERIAMLRAIGAHAAIAADETGVAEIDPRIMEVMGQVPRHLFVPPALDELAYADMPLPVNQEQSIAQPYLVALMTHLAALSPDDVVFETGTGAGYHAAVLAGLVRRVVSVETLAPLALEASARLKRLGYENVEVLASDGYYGAPRHAPFDAMIIKEAVDHVPPVLLRQLKTGGRMVLPLGPRDGPQYLTVIEKMPDGEMRSTRTLPVRFTPLQGGERI